MPDIEKTIRVLLDFIVNKGAVDQVIPSLDKADKAAQKIGQSHKQAGKDTDDAAKKTVTLAEKLEALQSIGIRMGAIGASITTPLVKAATDYTAAVNVTTDMGRRWAASNYEIDVSWRKVGSTMTGILLPAMEQIAGLAQTIAGFLEKNPTLLKVALGAGGIMGVAGGSLVAINQIAGLMKSLQTLGLIGTGASTAINALGGVGTAMYGPAAAGAGAAGGGIAAIASAAIPIVIPLVITAVAAYGFYKLMTSQQSATPQQAQSLQNQLEDKNASFGDKASAWAAQFVYKTIAFLKGEQYGQPGAPAGSPSGANTAIATRGMNVDPQVAATLKDYGMIYLQYLNQEKLAAQQYHLSISRETRDFYLQLQYSDQDYQRQKMRSVRDYNLQLTQSDFEFYRGRSLAVRDYYIDVRRSEEDFNRSRKRATEDHQWSLFQIIRSGDAMAYFEEMRQFNLSKSREQEDFNIQMQRKAEDFGRQQTDEANNYAIQRAFRQKQFEIQLKDSEIDFGIQRQRSKTQFNIQLADQAQDFQIQENQRQIQFNLQLVNMQDDFTKVGYLWTSLTNYMMNDLSSKLTELGAGNLQLFPTTIPGMQAGGYTGNGGPIMSHPGEFMLRADTVAFAEALAGRDLDQNLVMSMMKNGMKGGGRTLEYNDNRVFARGLSSEDRAMVNQDLEQSLKRAFS